MKKRYVLAICLAAALRTYGQQSPLSDFGPAKNIISGVSGAQSVYTADLDGDGDTDVLAASFNDDKITWYENDGKGNIELQRVITTQVEGAISVRAADIDGDGDIDVLSASYRASSVAWFENDGTGNFSELQLISDPAQTMVSGGVRAMWISDLDGDGDIDVLANYIDDVIWYENDGSGGFAEAQTVVELGAMAQDIYVADLDGDDDGDVLVASFAHNTSATWYENDGTGNFGEAQIITDQGSRSIYAADLDGDGDTDVLTIPFDYSGGVIWHENDGTGRFGEPKTINNEIKDARSVYARDLDGDGDVDVLSAHREGNAIAWYENDGSGSFGEAQRITTQTRGANDVYADDLDGDGDTDVLSASYFDDKVAWYQNDGTGRFGEQKIIATPADGLRDFDTSDLDGDEDADVLSASSDGKIAWYENDGTGTIGQQQIITTQATRVSSVHTADLDGDGDADVLSTSISGIAWYTNDGTGSFGELQRIDSSAALSVRTADLDGDGDIDVLSALSYYGYNNRYVISKVAWYENDGTGSFSNKQFITEQSEQADDLYVADLDNDGDSDVLIAKYGTIVWFENNGAGAFGEPQIIVIRGGATLYTADLNGDGNTDVLAASRNDDRIDWYKNDGEGNFSRQRLATAQGVVSFYTTDLDRDGDTDILSVNYEANTVFWYENEGAGNFAEPQIIDTRSTSLTSDSEVLASDLDGDGDEDVLLSSPLDGSLVWYENSINTNVVPTQITGLSLYRSREDTVVATLEDETVIDLTLLQGSGINIEADVAGDNIAEVAFDLQRRGGSLSVQRGEQVAPYVLFSHYGNDYFDLPAIPGKYALKIDAFEKDGSGKKLGDSRTINFTLISSAEAVATPIVANQSASSNTSPSSALAQITSLLLFRSSDDTQVATVEDGDIIDPALFIRSGFNVEASVQGKDIARIDFFIQGPDLTFRHTERKAPYVLFGHYGRDYFGPIVKQGRYTLVADLYINDADGRVRREQSLETTFTIRQHGSQSAILQVYPNTFNESLYIVDTELPENASLTVQLRTLQGQSINFHPDQIIRQSHRLRIDTQSIPAGHYVLQVTSAGKTMTRHVIKR